MRWKKKIIPLYANRFLYVTRWPECGKYKCDQRLEKTIISGGDVYAFYDVPTLNTLRRFAPAVKNVYNSNE